MTYDIGIFDSGLGGLSVYLQLKKRYPFYRFAYLADSKRCPYGIKSKDSILSICKNNLNFFSSLSVNQIVIACHTASVIAYESLKDQTFSPLIPMHFATKDCLLNLPFESSVLILGTQSTVQNGYYEKICRMFRKDIKVKSIGCPLLVEYIQNQINDPDLLEDIFHLYHLGTHSFDFVFLACTHFPFVKDFLKKKWSDKTTLIDPGELIDLYAIASLANPSQLEDAFFVTSQVEKFNQFSSLLLEKKVTSHLIEVEDYLNLKTM
ncbi:MAG: glutamate racemase [Chlamydiae bacterium]|nr:glutamate racemase [Chlamydiota bacterium]